MQSLQDDLRIVVVAEIAVVVVEVMAEVTDQVIETETEVVEVVVVEGNIYSLIFVNNFSLRFSQKYIFVNLVF